MPQNNWDAFGKEFAKCIDDIDEELKKIPRAERMALFRATRSWFRGGHPQQKKPPNNKRSGGVKRQASTNLWAPRK